METRTYRPSGVQTPDFLIGNHPFLGSDTNTLSNELKDLFKLRLGLLAALKIRNLEQSAKNSEKISPDKTTIKFNLEDILSHISEEILPNVNKSIQTQLENKEIENLPIVYLLTAISQLYQYYFEGNFLNLENILKQSDLVLPLEPEQNQQRENVYQQLLEIKKYFINYCGEITVDLLIKVFQDNQNAKLAEQTQHLSEYGKKFRSKEHVMCELVNLWIEFDNSLMVGQKQKFKLFALLCQKIFLPEFMTKSLAKAFLKSHQAFTNSIQYSENKSTSPTFSPEIAILISAFILQIKNLEFPAKLALGIEKLKTLFPDVAVEKLKISLEAAFYFASPSKINSNINLKKPENSNTDLDLGNVLKIEGTLIPENRCVIPRFSRNQDYSNWFLTSQLYQELLKSPDLQNAIIKSSTAATIPIKLTIIGLDGGIWHGDPNDPKSGMPEEINFLTPIEYCLDGITYACWSLVTIIIKDHHSPILETRENTDSTQTQVVNWLENISPFDVNNFINNFGLFYRVLEPIKGCDPDNLNSDILADLANLQFIKEHWETVKRTIQICGWIDVSAGAPDTKLYDLEYFKMANIEPNGPKISRIKIAQIMLVNQLISPFGTYFTLNRRNISQVGELILEDGALKMGAAQLLSLSKVAFFSFIEFLQERYPVSSSNNLNSLDQLLKCIFDRVCKGQNIWENDSAKSTCSITDFVETDLCYYWSKLKSNDLDEKLVDWIKAQTQKMLTEILTSSNEDCYQSNQINLSSKNEAQIFKLVLVTKESNYTRGQLLNLGYSHFLSYKGNHLDQTLSVITSGVLGKKTPEVILFKNIIDGCLNKLFAYYLKRDTPSIRGGLQAGSKEVGTPPWEVVEKCHKIVVLAIQTAIEKYGKSFDTIKELLESLTPENVMGEARSLTIGDNGHAQISELFLEIDKT